MSAAGAAVCNCRFSLVLTALTAPLLVFSLLLSLAEILRDFNVHKGIADFPRLMEEMGYTYPAKK